MLRQSVYTAITPGGIEMQTAPQPRIRREWRTRWAIVFQDALGTPEDDILDREFISEDAALRWANANPVVPLWLEQRDQLLGDNGNILGTITERFEI